MLKDSKLSITKVRIEASIHMSIKALANKLKVKLKDIYSEILRLGLKDIKNKNACDSLRPGIRCIKISPKTPAKKLQKAKSNGQAKRLSVQTGKNITAKQKSKVAKKKHKKEDALPW